jgi:hypothetical protein
VSPSHFDNVVKILKAGIITTAKPLSDTSTVDLALLFDLRRIAAFFGLLPFQETVGRHKASEQPYRSRRLRHPFGADQIVKV